MFFIFENILKDNVYLREHRGSKNLNFSYCIFHIKDKDTDKANTSYITKRCNEGCGCKSP